MKKDELRQELSAILSAMLDNLDGAGIYPTTKTLDSLEDLVRTIQYQTVGWTWAEACLFAIQKRDITRIEIPEVIRDFQRDFLTEEKQNEIKIRT